MGPDNIPFNRVRVKLLVGSRKRQKWEATEMKKLGLTMNLGMILLGIWLITTDLFPSLASASQAKKG